MAMDLTLSRRGDYVVRAAIYLAGRWREDRYDKIREVSEAMDLPRSFTPHILGTLVKAGLGIAKAGRAGGYRLARPPGEITLLEVVEAAEGPLAPDRCTLRGGPCHWEDVCALHPFWSSASEALRTSLGGTTLADLAAVDRDLAEGRLVAPADAHRLSRRATASRPADSGPS